jgi:hypothetical protein
MLRIRIRSTTCLRKWIVLGALIAVIDRLGAALRSLLASRIATEAEAS